VQPSPDQEEGLTYEPPLPNPSGRLSHPREEFSSPFPPLREEFPKIREGSGCGENLPAF
jgi:hypothetical protein